MTSSNQKNPSPSPAERHTNVAAAFTLLASLFLLIGLVTFGSAVEKRAEATTHVIAAAPLALAAASGAVAYSARKRAAASNAAPPTGGREAKEAGGDPGDRLPPAA